MVCISSVVVVVARVFVFVWGGGKRAVCVGGGAGSHVGGVLGMCGCAGARVYVAIGGCAYELVCGRVCGGVWLGRCTCSVIRSVGAVAVS